MILCTACLGCTTADDSAIPVITPTVEQPTANAVSEELEPRGEQVGGAENGIEPISENVAIVDYEPPFPDRDDPFQAPQRSSIASTNGVRNPTDDIQLLGFANVRGQKAILSINGMVVPIGEGGLESGIEVISIQPPKVVLQRNKQRWQASLEY